MNSYPTEIPSPLPVQEPAEELLSDEPRLFHEDVQDINERLRRLREQWGGLRVQRAFFRIPWPLSRSQYEEYRKKAVDRWLVWMEKEGWELKSKIHVKSMRPAYGYHGDWGNVPLLDQREISVLAAFQMKSVKPTKIEVWVRDESRAVGRPG